MRLPGLTPSSLMCLITLFPGYCALRVSPSASSQFPFSFPTISLTFLSLDLIQAVALKNAYLLMTPKFLCPSGSSSELRLACLPAIPVSPCGHPRGTPDLMCSELGLFQPPDLLLLPPMAPPFPRPLCSDFAGCLLSTTQTVALHGLVHLVCCSVPST